MSFTAELRDDGAAAAPERLSGSMSVLWILAGAALLALDIICLVPGNPVLDLSRSRDHRVWTFVSHGAVLLLLAGLWPARRRLLDAVARARASWRAIGIALAAALPVLAISAIGAWSPVFAHALCKEWGPIEPATVGVYLAAAWVAAETGRLRRGRGLAWRPFRLLAAVFVLLSLEEIDYFGIPSAIIGGRIGRVYVGSVHDLLNLGTWYPVVLPILGLVALAVGVAAGRAADLSLGLLWTEARHHSSWVMVAGLMVIAAAEVVDIASDVPARLETLFRADIEEPLELGGAALLGAGVLLKYRRDRDGGPRRVG